MAEFINTIDILGDDAVIDSIIDRSIEEFADDRLTIVGGTAFKNCKALHTVNLPAVTKIGSNGFANCTALANANFPSVETIEGSYVFSGSVLRYLDLPVLRSLSGVGVLGSREKFVALILRSETICTLGSTSTNDPFTAGTGYIYVPRALLSDDDETMDYRRATNWSNYAAQFRAIEDYTVDGTVTGEFSRCSNVALDKTTLTFEEWKTQTLTAICENLSPLGIDAVIWSSTDPSVAAVNDGVVSPIANGSTTITVTCNGHSATCEVVVNFEGMPMMYRLPEPTTFNGSSDYIDTGIKLFDTAKDFTIICEAEFSKLTDQNKCLLHCINEVSPWPGLSIDGSNGIRICYTGSSSLTTTISNRNAVSALAIRYVDGKMNAIRYKNTSGDIVTQTINGTPTYTKVTQNLLLGAYQDTSGTKGRFFNGTINRFEVYPTALSDEEIAAIL